MLLILGVIVGLILPLQTSVNSALRSRIGSPFLASATSFSIGMIFLAILTLIQDHTLFISGSIITNNPWWIWIGGAMGVIALTANVLLFPHLGAVQTVIMPILGQIIMSMLIDNFGWFNSPVHSMGIIRLVGIIALLIGVLMVVYRKNINKKVQSKDKPLFWQILGVFAGMALAIQTSVNGHLGSVLGSPVHADFFSFLIGTIILVVGVSVFERDVNNLKFAIGHNNPWWIWIGGLIGALYVLGNLFLAPRINVGTTVVLTLLGNIGGSLLIDKFGLIGTTKKNVGVRQYSGLILMIIGVILVKFF